MPTDLFFKFIIVTILTLSTYVFSFAQDSRAVSGNQGYVRRSAVPEEKKGTVIIKEGQESDFPIVGKLLDKKELTTFQAMSRDYRAKGLEAQNRGDLGAAMDFYSKAAQYDPGYAVVFNDLGVIYEANNDIERAEQNYLQVIKIDPNFLSPYSNLAILYENQRNLAAAAQYWKKRADLGSLSDPWTQKALARYRDIQMVLGQVPVYNREKEVVNLVKDVTVQKTIAKKEVIPTTCQEHYKKSKVYYKQQNYTMALKEAMEALQMNPPDSSEIESYISDIHQQMLAGKNTSK
jgi:tetratricopeptide (TPR) repeat protein